MPPMMLRDRALDRVFAPWRRLSICLLLLLSLLLGGCTTRLSYKFIDIWLAWSADDYVTLNSQQEALLDERLEALVEWHRLTQLPRYIEWLEGFRERVKQPMGVDDFVLEFDRLNNFIDDVLRRAEPDMIALLATLDDAQIRELEKNLQRRNEEMLEEYRDMMPAKRQRQREETATSNIQRWIGKLNRQERVLLRNWSRELLDTGEERYKTRIVWQQAFFDALALRSDPVQMQAALQPLLYQPANYRSAEYTAQLDKNQDMTFRMLAAVHQSLDKQQRKRLDHSLDSWLDTFRNLAASD